VYASNAVGSITDAQRVAELAREAGALSWIDAVHYAAHEPVDVQAIGCDVCSLLAVQVLRPAPRPCVRSPRAARVVASYKARPAGTTPVRPEVRDGHGAVRAAGRLLATIAYLESLGGMDVLKTYERDLGRRFLDTLPENVTVYGLQDDGGPRPDISDQRRRRRGRDRRNDDGRARLRRVGPTTPGTRSALREKLPYPDGCDPGRLHPLQHGWKKVDGFVAQLASFA